MKTFTTSDAGNRSRPRFSSASLSPSAVELTSASISSVTSAATCGAGSAPTVTKVIPSGPQPFCRANSSASHCVSEFTVEMPMRLPLRSSADFTGEFHGTMKLMRSGGPAMSATAISGTPLIGKMMSDPAPRPISRLPAAIA